jgi:site-specific DNA-methyltransferase (adenine-specific)
MGKGWDYDVPTLDVWREVWRVLKPGGHLLAFAGTRTQHRMAVNIEDAGFEIRDMIAWVYGSGFPKSLDVSKAIDKAAGAEREVVGESATKNQKASVSLKASKDHPEFGDHIPITAPATPEAQQWAGWGTALKPALEPITVARKSLEGTVAANVLAHGTGGLNVDGCRIAASDGYTENAVTQGVNTARTSYDPRQARRTFEPSTSGRWPANLIHDGSDQPCRLLDDAARFFYTAKAAKSERQGVTHPTVKPLDLMAYLCRLVTPPGGIVLDPFMGSGTTIKAALSEGFQGIGIEREEAYFQMAQHRLNGAQMGLAL